MPVHILPPTTAGIRPEKFSDDLFFAKNRKFAAIILAVFIMIGFALRFNNLGAESLSEDELNKLQTVEEYRANGLSGKNGEHPFLMKGLQTLSIITSDKVNNFVLPPQMRISDEAALRFPVALLGTFITLLIFLLVSELFGRSIGLISAALWAVEPMAIGFDRIAKEDSLVLFFFLLTNFFWIRGQTAAERGSANWLWHSWATAAGFAALMASKYYPHLLAITTAYYSAFQAIPGQKWKMGKLRWLKFFFIMGVVFLLLNPTVLLPETWHEMLKYSTESRIGHDSYEFMGHFYRNQLTAWLAGVPWTFYYVFIGVKTSLFTLIFFLIGLPMMFRRKLGDGRIFLLLWAFFWFMPFSIIGGKFTRYFAVAEPLVLIAAAFGFYYSVKWISNRFAEKPVLAAVFQTTLFVVLISFPLYNSLTFAPHFRLFTNSLGSHFATPGTYFPHDEFYDADTRDIVAEIARRSRQRAVVACETPMLFEYYARKIGRDDLVFVSLSDPSKVGTLVAGDFVVEAMGRRYFSNADYFEYLQGTSTSTAETEIMGITSARIYQLDTGTIAGLQAITKQ